MICTRNARSAQNRFIVYSCLVLIRSRKWHVSDVTLTRSPAVLNQRRAHTARPSDCRYDVAREKLEIICSRSFLSYLGSESLAERRTRPTRSVAVALILANETPLFWSSDFYLEGAQFWQLIIPQYISYYRI